MLRRVVLVLTTATRRNIPEDAILHIHRRKNLKYYTDNYMFIQYYDLYCIKFINVGYNYILWLRLCYIDLFSSFLFDTRLMYIYV
jgi:hypothetical protein